MAAATLPRMWIESVNSMLIYALAAFPALLFWIFLCWLIVLAGAAVTATLAEAGEREKEAV